MASRADPERITTARREAAIARVRSAGYASDRAVALVRDIETKVRARGLDPRSREYWDAVRAALDERLR